MNAESFTVALEAPGGMVGTARALAIAFSGQPGADRLVALAEAFLHPGLDLPDFSGLSGTDRLYAESLPTLRAAVDWTALRVRPDQARANVISPDSHDALTRMAPPADWGPLASFVHAALTRIRPARRAAVVVTMRDDGISILEWVAHCRAVGFEGIFVYSNDNEDGSDAMLNLLAAQGVITFIENRTTGTVSPQHKAFAHSLHFLPELRDFEWVFYADSDEFLIPGPEYEFYMPAVLDAVRRRYPDHAPSAILYHWRWYVSGYALARTRGLLLERFTHAKPHKLAKSVVRLADVLSMRILHFPELNGEGFFIDPSLATIPGSDEAGRKRVWDFHGNGYQGGQISHFWCKSFEEFLLKKRRGDLVLRDRENMYKRGLETYFDWNDEETNENAAPPSPVLLARVRAELDGLRALAGASALEDELGRQFRRLVATIGDARHVQDLYTETSGRTPPAVDQLLTADHGGERYDAVLFQLHAALKPDSYFEIGTLNGDTLSLARCASVAVDPHFQIKRDVTAHKPALHLFQSRSDEFFAAHSIRQVLGRTLDFAFLDGMHWYEFLLRDFMNTEQHCRPDSVIALHDCLPTDIYVARRDPDDHALKDQSPHVGWWAGDVWKVLLILKQYRPDLRMVCVDAPPTGLVLISNLDPGSTVLRREYDEILRKFDTLDIAEYGVGRLFRECAVRPTTELFATGADGQKRVSSDLTG